MSEIRERNPVATGWLVALVGLLIAGLLGYLMMWIGSNRLKKAEATERPYHLAFSHVAKEAVLWTDQADQAVRASNWGQARTFMGTLGAVITVMEQACSDADRERVRESREAYETANDAVNSQDREASKRLADLRARLDPLVVKDAEPATGRSRP